MTYRTVIRTAAAVSGSLILLLAVACGNGDAGLSRAQVQEIARAEVANAPAPQPGLTAAEVEAIVQAAVPAAPPPGLTRAETEEVVQQAMANRPVVSPGLSVAEVSRIVDDAIAGIPEPEPGITVAEVEAAIDAAIVPAIAGIPQPDPGLTSGEAEEIARLAVASIPPRSAPVEYTKFFVNNAITRYEKEGLEATLGHYNRMESVDGQWYLFIVDADDKVIGHYDANLHGEDLNGPIGTDANGYNFGPDMLSATGDGKWVSYVYRNPESGNIATGDFGELELKNVWVVKHDGLLFASGWYIDADEFTRLLVSIALERFNSGGLEATVAYFAAPESALAGLEEAISYYNEAETVTGKWSAFIAADQDGMIVAHSDPAMIGSELLDLFGTSEIEATPQGNWVTTDAVRMWVARTGGFVFGSGWLQGDSEG